MSCSEFLSVHVRWRIPADYLQIITELSYLFTLLYLFMYLRKRNREKNVFFNTVYAEVDLLEICRFLFPSFSAPSHMSNCSVCV